MVLSLFLIFGLGSTGPNETPDFWSPSSSELLWDEASDILYVYADGEPGQDGQSSWIGQEPSPGTSGASGGNIQLVLHRLPKQVIISARGGNGGSGARGSRGLAGARGESGRKGSLFRSPEPGTDGEAGQAGGDASNGGHGGSGGQIKIIYLPLDGHHESYWELKIQADVSGGVGGPGGEPGLGGSGGEGGEGGRRFWSSRRAASGQRGPDGVPGQRGQAGENGEEGSIEFLEFSHYEELVLEELPHLEP
jgi:hypothetical protein